MCLMLGIELLFSSCATHKRPDLVSDPDGARESTIPWNKQEQWESGAEMGPVMGGGPSGSDRR